MSKLKVIFLSLLVVSLSFFIFTLFRLPYERILDRSLKGLERGGIKVSYKEVEVEPLRLKASFKDAEVKTNLFNLAVKNLEGRLLLGEVLFSFKIRVELRFYSGNLKLPVLPGNGVAFDEGRAIIERGSKGVKVSELLIKGREILVMGEINGNSYNLRIKPSENLEKALSNLLKLLQKDKEGFYNLRSGI